jgi:hypothetical protein
MIFIEIVYHRRKLTKSEQMDLDFYNSLKQQSIICSHVTQLGHIISDPTSRTLIHWNHLPNSVVHANSLEAFKTALRNQRQ